MQTLSYFNNIIPCGIVNKQVTSVEKEVGHKVDFGEVKEKIKENFARVFNVEIISIHDHQHQVQA